MVGQAITSVLQVIICPTTSKNSRTGYAPPIQLDARRVSLKDLSVSLGVRGQVKSACNLREEASCTHFA